MNDPLALRWPDPIGKWYLIIISDNSKCKNTGNKTYDITTMYKYMQISWEYVFLIVEKHVRKTKLLETRPLRFFNIINL